MAFLSANVIYYVIDFKNIVLIYTAVDVLDRMHAEYCDGGVNH